MAVLPIRITGDPVLHAPAKPVGRVTKRIHQLVADMIETMHAAPGVGLAAPQVGESLRIFVWSWDEDEGTTHSGVAIDPELWITPTSLDELDAEEESEGCLSIPGERFALRRAEGAILRANDLDGTAYEIEAHGWLARIFQHEFDHLDGVLYADRLAAAETKGAAKAIKKQGWGLPGLAWTPGIDKIEA